MFTTSQQNINILLKTEDFSFPQKFCDILQKTIHRIIYAVHQIYTTTWCKVPTRISFLFLS